MKYAINACDAPDIGSAASLGTTAGRLVFTSGLLAYAQDNPEHLCGTTAVEQAERILDIAESLLAETSCNLGDVAKITVYLADLNDFAAVERVLELRFPKPAPARSVLEVSRLPLDALVEMDCVACR